MKEFISVYDLALLLEDGERVVIKHKFDNIYETDKENILSKDYLYKYLDVISFRYSTNYNKILIEC